MHMSISQKRSGMFAITVALISSLLLALTSCSSNSQDLVKINLAPAPYSIQVPSEIAKHLTIENMATDAANEFSAQAKAAGAIAQVRINYIADDGSIHGFAGVYYFAKADFEKAQNPNEPPLYGSKVVEENSMVLAIAGPHDSIFEPATQDGKNSMALYALIYDPQAFKSS
jgi:hypothetical protein